MAVVLLAIAICLLSPPVVGQRSCESCVTVQGDPGDPLVGTYRFLVTTLFHKLCVLSVRILLKQ